MVLIFYRDWIVLVGSSRKSHASGVILFPSGPTQIVRKSVSTPACHHPGEEPLIIINSILMLLWRCGVREKKLQLYVQFSSGHSGDCSSCSIYCIPTVLGSCKRLGIHSKFKSNAYHPVGWRPLWHCKRWCRDTIRPMSVIFRINYTVLPFKCGNDLLRGKRNQRTGI